jgi:hypothetical protein
MILGLEALFTATACQKIKQCKCPFLGIEVVFTQNMILGCILLCDTYGTVRICPNFGSRTTMCVQKVCFLIYVVSFTWL